MRVIAILLIAFVALEHAGFLVLEMFLWEHEIAQKAFDLTPEFTSQTSFMAANQGLYNGFLAAGLVWGLLGKKRDVVFFFLGCVIIAGLYGGMTVKPSIYVIQALPAALAFLATLFSGLFVMTRRSSIEPQ